MSPRNRRALNLGGGLIALSGLAGLALLLTTPPDGPDGHVGSLPSVRGVSRAYRRQTYRMLDAQGTRRAAGDATGCARIERCDSMAARRTAFRNGWRGPARPEWWEA